jgi:hypothetical protein
MPWWQAMQMFGIGFFRGTSNNDDFFVELIAGASATVILAHNLS